MEKEEKIFKEEGEILGKEEITFLNQLVKTLEEAESKLEQAYEKRNHENFNRLKKLILQVQKKISEVIK